MRSLSKLLYVFTALAVGLFVAGCDNPFDVPDNPAFVPSLTIYGKIKDGATAAGVGGAKVSVKVNGAWKTATSSTSTATILNEGGATRQIDTALGDWVIGGLPTNMRDAPIVVQGGGTYAIQFDNLDFPDGGPGVGGNVSVNLGDTVLEQGVETTIYVVDALSGQYVTRPSNAALTIFNTNAGFQGFDTVRAAQDGTDTNKYTLVLPQTGEQNGNTESQLGVLPVDSDGDNALDYQAAVALVTDYEKKQQAGKPVVIIPLSMIAPNGNSPASIQVLASSFDNQAQLGNFLAESEAVTLFFNQPVALEPVAAPVKVQTTFNLTPILQSAPAAVQVTFDEAGSGLSVAQSLANTLLTVTMAAKMNQNESYTIQGALKGYQVFGQYDRQIANLSGLAGGNWDVDFEGATGITGASQKITLDNGNRCSNGALITGNADPGDCPAGGTTFASGPFLMFPERVNGRVTVTAYTVGAVTTTVGSPSPVSITCTGGSMNFYASNPTTTRGTGGYNYGDAAACAQNIAGFGGVPANMLDNFAGAANVRTVTVIIDVWDSNNNHYVSTAAALPVE